MTKKSTEILGLPVISVTEGRELGISKTLVIDARGGVVAAITIEDEDWYRGVKLLPYSSVIAIGRDAVTVTSSESILTLEDATDFEFMLDENIRIIGTKAITKSGTINGVVNEIFIGEDGVVERVRVVTPQGVESEIPSDEISIFGKQVTVIGEPGDGAGRERTAISLPERLAPKAEPKGEQKPAPTAEPVSPPAPAPEPAPVPGPAAEPEPPTTEAEPEPGPAPESEAEQTAADKATMDRHRRFLRGKKAARDIVTNNGVVIAKAGEEITEAVIQKVQLAGKLIELSMNAQ